MIMSLLDHDTNINMQDGLCWCTHFPSLSTSIQLLISSISHNPFDNHCTKAMRFSLAKYEDANMTQVAYNSYHKAFYKYNTSCV